LENTLGGTVVWTRDDVGVYFGTLAGVFTENKTFFLATIEANSIPGFITAIRSDGDAVAVVSYDEGGAAQDGQIFFLEIRVYP
jgi:hypothetical protein